MLQTLDSARLGALGRRHAASAKFYRQRSTAWWQPLLYRLLLPKRVRRLYRQLQARPEVPLWRGLLEALQVQCAFDAAQLAHLPATGPAVVVANHPHGLLEGALALDLLLQRRPDARLLVNRQLLAGVVELQEVGIPIDPFDGPHAAAVNRAGVAAAREVLRAGGVVVAFPAGEVASFRLPPGRSCDPPWRRTAAHLAREVGAPLVPLYFSGGNSASFHLLGLLHPRLRTLRLMAELLNKRRCQLTAALGAPLGPALLDQLDDARLSTALARLRTLLLAPPPRRRAAAAGPAAAPAAVGEPPAAAAVRGDIAALPAACRLYENETFEVWSVRAAAAPYLMRALGVARELTFRAAGAGSGKPCDLDAFDYTYDHLILWHRPTQTLAGAYRVGRVEALCAAHGSRGLYTASLFHLRRGFLQRLGPALEVGRSFVVPAQQRQPLALASLWRGLGCLLGQHPEVHTLFGAVSISQDYQPASRALLQQALRSAHPLSAQLRPRCAAAASRLGLSPLVADATRQLSEALLARPEAARLPALAQLVRHLEPGGRSMPVLLRSYLRLGGEALCWSLDARFGNTLDALVAVDLRRAPAAQLRRYLGEAGLHAFAARHGAPADADTPLGAGAR